MATITFYLAGRKKEKDINLRLTVGRGGQFRTKTFETIEETSWDIKNKLPKKKDAISKNLATRLGALRNHLETACNISEAKGEKITLEWVKMEVRRFNGGVPIADKSILLNYFDIYIKSLNYKTRNNVPISEDTKVKYTTIRNKVAAFEKFRKEKLLVKDVNNVFRNEFIDYLHTVQKLAKNTAGRYVIFVKTVCLDAKFNDVEVSPQLGKLQGYKEEVNHIYFTFNEIEQIEKAELNSEALENARDWLIIGCFIGQRVSDLLPLTAKNLDVVNDVKVIRLTQKKTNKKLAIPLHPKVQMILDKNNGKFPRKISAAKFNIHIKKIAEKAGFNEEVEGSVGTVVNIEGKDVQRRKYGIFQKHLLVTSHICRRSFATNYYGEMPTSLIIAVTGHSSELQYLKYVGKEPIDHAPEVARYLHQIHEREQTKIKEL